VFGKIDLGHIFAAMVVINLIGLSIAAYVILKKK